jgi:hypothetical protein
MSKAEKAKKHIKSVRGQILVLFLLLLVVGLAIVLSLASRTVTDIRTTTTSDESNRAYFAAEAGIEEALKKMQDPAAPPTLDFTLNFPDLKTSAKTKTKTTASGRVIYVVPFDVSQDEVAQVNMLTDPNDYATGWTGQKLDIYWGNKPFTVGDTASENQALEISMLYYPNSGSWCDSLMCLTKVIFDPFAARPPNPDAYNFCTPSDSYPPGGGVSKKDSVSGEEKTFYFRAGVNIRTGAIDGGPACFGTLVLPSTVPAPNPVFTRLKPLFNDGNPIPIAVEVDPAVEIPNQEVLIESTGKTVSGVTRKIQVKRLLPALPAIFDMVLFNGGDDPLIKD